MGGFVDKKIPKKGKTRVSDFEKQTKRYPCSCNSKFIHMDSKCPIKSA